MTWNKTDVINKYEQLAAGLRLSDNDTLVDIRRVLCWFANNYVTNGEFPGIKSCDAKPRKKFKVGIVCTE